MYFGFFTDFLSEWVEWNSPRVEFPSTHFGDESFQLITWLWYWQASLQTPKKNTKTKNYTSQNHTNCNLVQPSKSRTTDRRHGRCPRRSITLPNNVMISIVLTRAVKTGFSVKPVTGLLKPVSNRFTVLWRHRYNQTPSVIIHQRVVIKRCWKHGVVYCFILTT